ncbi:MAG: hypothetical protein V3U92_10995 [Cellulophaga sp.]
MTKIVEINEFKNGKKNVEFFELGIYKILKEKFGFRYTKIDKKGYYLKYDKGVYSITNFQHLRDCFHKYLNQEFNNLDLSEKIDFEIFINAYYKKLPVKNGNFCREYLSYDFELTEKNICVIRKKLNPIAPIYNP